MTKRKAFLLGGLFLLCASSVFASERTRMGAARDGGSASGEVALSEAYEIAPGVMAVDTGTSMLTASVDGVVDVDFVLEQYGSLLGYEMANAMAFVKSYPDPSTGGVIYANGVAPMLSQSIGSMAQIWSYEDHRDSTLSASTIIDGNSVEVLADGVVAIGTDSANQPVNRNIPSVTTSTGTLWADGSVEVE